MKPLLPLLCALPFIGGCALPIPVQVAMWALDGVSVASSEKTLTDHGLSAFSQRDCSMWRGLTSGGDVCRETVPVMVSDGIERIPAMPATPVTVAELEPLPREAAEEPAKVEVAEEVAKVEVAAAPRAEAAVSTAELSIEELASFATAAGPSMETPFVLSAAGAAPRADEVPVSDRETAKLVSAVTLDDVYCIVGSFGEQQQADEVALRYREYAAEVMTLRFDGRLLYRVTIGPFDDKAGDRMRARLVGAGAPDVWLWRGSMNGPESASAERPRSLSPIAVERRGL